MNYWELEYTTLVVCKPPVSPSLHHNGMGERIGKIRQKKLLGLDKDRLISEERRRVIMKAVTQHQRLMSSQSSTYSNIGKTATQILPLSMMLYSVECWFGHCESAVMALFSPSLFTGEAEWETEKGLMLSVPCSTITKRLLC